MSEIEEFAAELGADMAGFFAEDDYYDDVDPDMLDDVIDDAWMMGATQDSFEDAGFDIHGDSTRREAARAAFARGFREALTPDP